MFSENRANTSRLLHLAVACGVVALGNVKPASADFDLGSDPVTVRKKPRQKLFRMRPLTPKIPKPGVRSDIRQVAARVLGKEQAEQYAKLMPRWNGPAGEGARKGIEKQQHFFVETTWKKELSKADIEQVLRGEVLVMRNPKTGKTDYIARDHNTLDIMLYHYATTGQIPDSLFHLDRHSDYEHRPAQAATPQAASWWGGFWHLRRPNGRVMMNSRKVIYATAVADKWPRSKPMTVQNIGVAFNVPAFATRRSTTWNRASKRLANTAPNCVSIDLDAIQPSAQFSTMKKMLDSKCFQSTVCQAPMRMFVLSPQFTNGGDLIPPAVNGNLAASQRLINLLRNIDL